MLADLLMRILDAFSNGPLDRACFAELSTATARSPNSDDHGEA